MPPPHLCDAPVPATPAWNVRTLLPLVLVAIAAGCGSGPAAPVLRDSPVYRSATEGFRCRVPDGWSQTANSALPSGNLPRDIILARSRVQSPEGGASLQVLARNDLPTGELEAYAKQPAFGVADWQIAEPLSSVTIGGEPADRIVCAGKLGGKTMLKPVTCFHRRGRLYAFVGLYWQTDPTVRQQVERAVESIIWD